MNNDSHTEGAEIAEKESALARVLKLDALQQRYVLGHLVGWMTANLESDRPHLRAAGLEFCDALEAAVSSAEGVSK